MSNQGLTGPMPAMLAELKGETVVVDTDSAFVYIGILEACDDQWLALSAVDVNELNLVNFSKEKYVHEASKIGVRNNREATWVNLNRVLSISRLADIVQF
jgi:small nuclear ribonucleoprotein (snRNP)-like protein